MHTPYVNISLIKIAQMDLVCHTGCLECNVKTIKEQQHCCWYDCMLIEWEMVTDILGIMKCFRSVHNVLSLRDLTTDWRCPCVQFLDFLGCKKPEWNLWCLEKKNTEKVEDEEEEEALLAWRGGGYNLTVNIPGHIWPALRTKLTATPRELKSLFPYQPFHWNILNLLTLPPTLTLPFLTYRKWQRMNGDWRVQSSQSTYLFTYNNQETI